MLHICIVSCVYIYMYIYNVYRLQYGILGLSYGIIQYKHQDPPSGSKAQDKGWGLLSTHEEGALPVPKGLLRLAGTGTSQQGVSKIQGHLL